MSATDSATKPTPPLMRLDAMSCSGFFFAGWRRAFDAEKDKTEEYCGRQTCTWKCAGIAIRLYDAETRYNQQYGTQNKTNSAD